MNTFKSMSDIRQYISDQPLDNPELYQEDYIELVAWELRNYLFNLDWEYGEELPEISSEDFWDLFKIAEKEGNNE